MIAYGQTITNEGQLRAIQTAQANLLAMTAPTAPRPTYKMRGLAVVNFTTALNQFQQDQARFVRAQQEQQQQFKIQQQQFQTELARSNNAVQSAIGLATNLNLSGALPANLRSQVSNAVASAAARNSSDLRANRIALMQIASATRGRVAIFV